jgi:hypothetical protein
MKLLVEIGELSRREVARKLGLARSATVSWHLKVLANEVKSDPALGRLLKKA